MTDISTQNGLVLDQIKIGLDGDELISIDAQIMPGDVLTVMGPSGSGKSTLLAFIGGFLDPVFSAQGHVRYEDICLTHLPAHERRTGILFQDPLLFPHLSVLDNLLLAIPPTIKGRKSRREMACKALESAGLSGFDDRDPDTLSGGQKARVALQRVLLSQPRLLLLDEPFSKLDMELRTITRQMVFDTAKKAKLPVILVTHDEADAEAANGQVHLVSMLSG